MGILNQNAVAITDNNSLASAWIAYKEAKKIGIKYIVGLEISFTDDNSNKEQYFRVVAGSYKERSNADEQISKLKDAGFDSFVNVFYK